MVSRRRERELARQRYLRRQQLLAEQRARARRRTAIIASVVIGVLVLGGGIFALVVFVGGDDGDDTLAQPTPTATSSSTAAPQGCQYVDSPTESSGDKKVTKPQAQGLERERIFVGSIKTNRGTVRIRMPSVKAPCTVNSFRSLAGQDYFDDTECHRLTTEPGSLFVLQCGDPTATGSGGPGYSFPDENLEGASYPAGTVAMANSGPNTNGSQFFIVYKDSQLPPSYTPFGTVTGGLSVVTKVAAEGAEPPGDGKPKQTVTIEDFTIKARR